MAESSEAKLRYLSRGEDGAQPEQRGHATNLDPGRIASDVRQLDLACQSVVCRHPDLAKAEAPSSKPKIYLLAKDCGQYGDRSFRAYWRLLTAAYSPLRHSLHTSELDYGAEEDYAASLSERDGENYNDEAMAS